MWPKWRAAKAAQTAGCHRLQIENCLSDVVSASLATVVLRRVSSPVCGRRNTASRSLGSHTQTAIEAEDSPVEHAVFDGVAR